MTPEKLMHDMCPACGKKCTLSLSYFCWCGWEQTGNNHEAWLKRIDLLEQQLRLARKLLEKVLKNSQQLANYAAFWSYSDSLHYELKETLAKMGDA